MDLNHITALIAALASLGLGTVALVSWLKLRAVITLWDKVSCSITRVEDRSAKAEFGEVCYFLNLTFDTPRGLRMAETGSSDTRDELEIQKRHYTVGSRHTVYLSPKDPGAHLTPPWSTHNPTVPAIFSIGFAAAAVGLWMGWIKAGG